MEIDNISNKAWDLARKAHNDQVDKTGDSYINHVVRVANTAHESAIGGGEYEDTLCCYIVGLLHDVVEDTPYALDEIYKNFGRNVGLSIDAITHRPHELYWDYIKRVATDRVAIRVKLADLEDNSNLARMCRIKNGKEFKRVSEYLLPRYIRAYRYLTRKLEEE